MNTENLEFYKRREFGEKFNATFTFIRNNFSILIKYALLIAAPFGILTAVAYSEVMGQFAQLGYNMGSGNYDDFNPLTLFSGYSMLAILGGISYSLLLSGIYIFIKSKVDGNPITDLGELFKLAIKKVPGLIGLMILIGIISSFGFILFILPGIYLLTVFALSFPVYIFEDVTVSEAISRPFKLIKEKWWSTFGLSIIATMIASMCSYIFAIPYYIVLFMGMFENIETNDPNAILESYSSLETTVSMGFLMVGSYVTYLIPIIAMAFQYSNLREKLESTGLKSEIDNFENLA